MEEPMLRIVTRRQMRAKRQALDHNARHVASQCVARHVMGSRLFQRAKHIAFYHPNQGELDPTPMLHYIWQMNKHCYLPILHPLKHNLLWFGEYQQDTELMPNSYGIPEPMCSNRQVRPPWAMNIVFVPLVAFDKKGNRIGMGSGYYDRTFAFTQQPQRPRPKLIGLAYDFQEVDAISTERWDIPLDAVVTPSQLIVS